MTTLKQFIDKAQGWDTPIVQALEDTDFYKFTMCNVYDKLFPDVTMEMLLHCRTQGVDITKYAGILERELDYLCSLGITSPTIERMSQVPYFTPGYVDFLRLLRLRRDHIHVSVRGTDLLVRTNGPARLVTWFEIQCLQIVQEAYFRDVHADLDLDVGKERLASKIKRYSELVKRHPFALSEFGSRRRAAFAWQEYVVKELINAFGTHGRPFVGTSNVLLAVKYNSPFSGTMAHEYLEVGQALKDVRLDRSVIHMLEAWVQVYRGQLGIALSDVVGMEAFLRDFDLYFAKLFDGMRHDSGDPFWWADLALDHYRSLRIDPITKTLLFSDGVVPDLLEALVNRYYDQARLAFGVGGDFTNDLGVKGLNIVMKAVRINGRAVAKVPDSLGKGMCEDPGFETYLRTVFKIGASNG
jgi:nicotinate phosphoribosyltransferase